MKSIALSILFIALAASAQAQPIIVDPSNGKYLGNLNGNTLDPNSVNNPLGRYGSPLSPDSINNPLSEYGNPVSPKSPYNPLATQAPVIIDNSGVLFNDSW
jgi:hypothetical protein